MANEVEIKITADGSSAEAGFKKVKTGFQSMKDSIVKNRKAIGVGILAMGAGIEALAKKQQPLTEATRKLAVQTGFEEDAIRDMATELSNATFPLDSALELMKLGSQRGLESEDALKKYATFWDTIGDATGLGAKALADSGLALGALGIKAGEEEKALAAFGLVMSNGAGDVGGFLKMIERVAPDLNKLDIPVGEAAQLFVAMQEEMNLTAKVATTELKEALEQSTTGISGVMEILGLTEEQMAKYSKELANSGDVAQQMADAHASSKTVMDKLKSSFEDLTFANGAMIEKASMIAPLFVAAGPIVAGFGPITTTAMTIAGTAVKGFSIAVKLAMGPAGLALLAVTAMIAIGVLLYKNWDTVKEKADLVFKYIRTLIVQVFTKITDIYNSKLGWLLPAGPLIKAILFLKDNWDEIWDGIQTKFKTVSDALVAIFRSVKGTILGIWDGMVSGIKSAIDTIMETIDRVINAASRVGGAIRSVTTLGGLTGREHGGPVGAGQPVIVGERRPELFVPHTSGTILPRIIGASGSGGGGVGITVNLTIMGDVNGMDDFEQKVTSVIRDAVLGGGFSGVLARA